MTASKVSNLESLVARSREGDRAAAEALVEAIQPTVYKLAQRFLMVAADAEDATQEILLKIITRLGQFEGKSSFRTWAYSVASHHLLDLKRRPSEQAMTFDEFAEDLAQGLSDVPFEGPDRALMLEEVRLGCTLAMLQCLDRESRMAYILGEILELNHHEAAEVLGTSAAAYRKRLSRSRTTINASMLGNCGLVKPSNRCRCSKRTGRAIELGRVRPGAPELATSEADAERFPEVLAEIRQLEESQRAAALYRAQHDPEASPAFTLWLRKTLEQHEERRQ